MHRKDLVALLERMLGVDQANQSPFAPRVELCMGPQGKAPEIAGKLALCEKGALIFQPRGTSRFAMTVSCKQLKLFFLLRKITDEFYHKKEGRWKTMPYFSDTWLALFGCSEELADEIAYELGIRQLSMLLIDKYRVIEPVIDSHSTAMKQGILPKRRSQGV